MISSKNVPCLCKSSIFALLSIHIYMCVCVSLLRFIFFSFYFAISMSFHIHCTTLHYASFQLVFPICLCFISTHFIDLLHCVEVKRKDAVILSFLLAKETSYGFDTGNCNTIFHGGRSNQVSLILIAIYFLYSLEVKKYACEKTKSE